MVAWRYDFYLLVLKTIFYSFAALVRKILFSHALEDKSHIFAPPCNILYLWTVLHVSMQENPRSIDRHNCVLQVFILYFVRHGRTLTDLCAVVCVVCIISPYHTCLVKTKIIKRITWYILNVCVIQGETTDWRPSGFSNKGVSCKYRSSAKNWKKYSILLLNKGKSICCRRQHTILNMKYCVPTFTCVQSLWPSYVQSIEISICVFSVCLYVCMYVKMS